MKSHLRNRTAAGIEAPDSPRQDFISSSSRHFQAQGVLLYGTILALTSPKVICGSAKVAVKCSYCPALYFKATRGRTLSEHLAHWPLVKRNKEGDTMPQKFLIDALTVEHPAKLGPSPAHFYLAE